MILLLIDELPTPELPGAEPTHKVGVVHQGANMRTEGAEGSGRAACGGSVAAARRVAW